MEWNAESILFFDSNNNGSFNGTSYQTGMSLLALALNYRFLPIYER